MNPPNGTLFDNGCARCGRGHSTRWRGYEACPRDGRGPAVEADRERGSLSSLSVANCEGGVSFASKGILVVLSQFLAIGFGALGSVVLYRGLGPAGTGQFNLFRNFGIFAATAAAFGLGNASVYLPARHKGPSRGHSRDAIWLRSACCRYHFLRSRSQLSSSRRATSDQFPFGFRWVCGRNHELHGGRPTANGAGCATRRVASCHNEPNGARRHAATRRTATIDTAAYTGRRNLFVYRLPSLGPSASSRLPQTALPAWRTIQALGLAKPIRLRVQTLSRKPSSPSDEHRSVRHPTR